MPQFSSPRVLTLSALALLVVLSGVRGAGQEQGDHERDGRGAPPLGLGLGHDSYSEVVERIVDRSAGHVAVDPNALHPPAFSPDERNGFVFHAPKAYTCWRVPPQERRDYAPGTAVACYVSVTLADEFVYGDGSLADNPAGHPDDFFGYDCPQGFSVKDFTKNRWRAIRYFDKDLNQMGAIRVQRYDGRNYNYTTGKSVRLQAHYVEVDIMQPADGRDDGSNEFAKFLGDDYGPITGPHGEVLADSAGRIDYTPFLATILYISGPHPIDAFYAGDPGGILPVCEALK